MNKKSPYPEWMVRNFGPLLTTKGATIVLIVGFAVAGLITWLDQMDYTLFN